MKKVLIPLCLVVGCQMLMAQRTQQFVASDRLFKEGKELFQLKNYPGCTDKLAAFKKESKHGLLKGIMAVSTAGMSIIAEKAVKGINTGTIKDVYNFSDLNSFELMEDDSQVTSGGVGQALVGGLLFDGAGLIAGGITGKRKTKKVVESMFIKLHINDFNNPLIMIPLITEKTKINSKEYKEEFNLANQLIAMLDLITHNK